MQQFSLNGDWSVQQIGGTATYPAHVPGCVHLDLLAAKAIEDPFYRDNELNVQWISDVDWQYSRSFTVEASLLACDQVLLRCEGLDTLASISLNGQHIASTDNMFRVWEFDAKPHLHAGENQIVIMFRAALPYVQHQEATVAPLYAWGIGSHKSNGGGWIRKQPSNFGWDWGPVQTTVGIWRDISLIGIENARLQDVNILQQHANGAVSLEVQVAIENVSPAALSVEVEVTFNGTSVARQVSAPSQPITLAIPDPHLWWPNGMGSQPLYEVVVRLRKAADTILDTHTKRIGLRTLRLNRHADQWGESFEFVVNGVPFFAKGANWIPADTFVNRVTTADYRRLIEAARDVHMNMLRVWGGGIYEPDVFYDLCDELGICIWQDFMFACATYPAFDAPFRESVRAEARDAVTRIRHHASLALWCGNNELEQGLVADEWTVTTMSWADYGLLFDDLLKQVVNELSPQTDYWPSSPHTPVGNRTDWRSAASGDMHNWDVWHGRQPFEYYRTTLHRFISEFGFQSFPEPRTVEAYTLPQDRNITSYIMEHHQRSLIGNSTIVHYMTDWFRLPTSFDKMLWLSQVLQGLAIKYAVEHWRRNMPRTMGALFWQINDCWPVASWASIDFYGRWKALHYFARQFFAPLLISGVEDIQRGTVDVYLTSDLGSDQPARIEWALTDLDGATLQAGTLDVTATARASQCVQTLDVSQQVKAVGARQVLLWLELQVDGKPVSSNLVTFARPKHLDLHEPGFATTLRQHTNGRDIIVTLTAKHPALYVWLTLGDIDASLSDNFFHLSPARSVDITISGLPANVSLTDVQKQLQVNSLLNTYD